MKKLLPFLLIAWFCFSTNKVYAQEDLMDSQKVFPQKVLPETFSNYSFLLMYINDGWVYSLMGTALNHNIFYARQLDIQPGGGTCAILVKRKDGKELESTKVPCHVEIYESEGEFMTKLKNPEKIEIISIGYAPDGRSFVTGNVNKCLKFYETRNYTQYMEMNIGVQPTVFSLSGNNYFVAAAEGNTVEVWALQARTLRKKITSDSNVSSVAFSEDNSMMAVLTKNGDAVIYDTKDFSEKYTLNNMGNAIACRFHTDNKYLGVVTDESTIVLQNIRNAEDRLVFENPGGGINKISFVDDYVDEGGSYLLYTSGYDVVWQKLGSIKINLTQYINEQAGIKMNEWLKRREGESMEDYQIRVNDETRLKQRMEFEKIVATEMAGDILNRQNARLGKYNMQTEKLAVDFDELSSITLGVPRDEIAGITTAADLEFVNTVYGVNEKDEFEIIYAEALNRKTGKKYIFDNLDRKIVATMTMDEDFVPLNVIRQSSMEEMRLKEIRKKIVDEAKCENKITDHTNISVNTEVVTDFDASGRKIINYKVGYSYEVQKDFVANDDFAPGKYKIEDSNAGMSMLAIVNEAFGTDFAQYIKAGKQIKIKLIGSADASPIKSKIAYDKCYGEYNNELIYMDGKLNRVDLSKESGITENKQLAFVRALGVKNYIEQNIPALKDMKCDYQYNVEVSDKKGGEYRRIGVEFLFIDAFEK